LGGDFLEQIRAPRGTRDILGDESWKWAYVTRVFRETTDCYGYREVYLPVFEHTELFTRGVGDTTDVVEKEMYTFTDRGGRSITLRPEFTASMVRSYLENDMRKCQQPVKLWSIGPAFRYERPQKGRYRQFVQLDLEAIGSQDALVDFEIIDLAMEIFRRLGLTNLKVVLNSVGCSACRPVYREALRGYLSERYDRLCDTCKSRYERNPLRILDCKKSECKGLTEDAPSIMEYLCAECSAHFGALTSALDRAGVAVDLDKRLVRGLDYYTKTAFEIHAGGLGSQNAVCGGGRYDNLAEAIGGPHVPGVGFALGVERIVMTMEAQGLGFSEKPANAVYVVSAEPGLRTEAMALLRSLRRNNIAADMYYTGRSMKSQMKAAGSSAKYACIIGGDELSRNVVTVKNLDDGSQEELTPEALIFKLKNGEVSIDGTDI